MVDRITPRPPPDVAERVKAATGVDDAAPVMAESFIQWVVEDRFGAGRPAWERVGVEMVASVHAHEEAKIRILNASHSCIAWAGTLRGLSFIHEGVAVPAIRAMAWNYVTDDVIPCLDSPAHPAPIDLAAYRDSVLDRFGNAFVRDTNQRVAMDGFSKIPGSRRRCASESRVASRSRAPRCCRRCSSRSSIGGIAASLPTPIRTAPWTQRRRMPSSPRWIRCSPSAATRCSGPTSPATRIWSLRFAKRTVACRPSLEGD
jgi:hypothetical protein